jgi:hypothetical protein
MARLPLGLPLPLVPYLRPRPVHPLFLPLWPLLLRQLLLLLVLAAASFPRAVRADRWFWSVGDRVTRPEFLLLVTPPRPVGCGSGASVWSAASAVGLPAVVGPPGLAVATPPPAVRPVAAVLAEDQDPLPGPRVTTWLLEGFPLRALDPKCLAIAGRLFLRGGLGPAGQCAGGYPSLHGVHRPV